MQGFFFDSTSPKLLRKVDSGRQVKKGINGCAGVGNDPSTKCSEWSLARNQDWFHEPG